MNKNFWDSADLFALYMPSDACAPSVGWVERPQALIQLRYSVIGVMHTNSTAARPRVRANSWLSEARSDWVIITQCGCPSVALRPIVAQAPMG